MKPYLTNIEKDSLENTDFRRVLYTGYLQLVLMSLDPNEDIGNEVHDHVDQFFRFEGGEGKVVTADGEITVGDGDVVVIPAGTYHNIINTSATERLSMYTIYSPANHPDGTRAHTKEEAEELEKNYPPEFHH
ncbi:MAG: cupin domain-containing protein [Anaerolineaceae bacterium]|jgi:mannose-6-phosphate isomerase-like protein (cupin superfamily)